MHLHLLQSATSLLTENLTTAGATIITADSDGSGVGDFSIDASTALSTGNNSLALTANDVTVSGSLSSGTGSTTIAVSDGGTIGLGGTVREYDNNGYRTREYNSGYFKYW